MHHPSTRRYFRHGMLPQLLVFEAIARLGSLTRAAEEVCLAQPTVSAQLKKLTHTVGSPLVEQVGKKLYLTEVGKALHRSCEELIDLLQRTEDRIAQAHSPELGTLRVAVTASGHHHLRAHLAAFCRRYARVKVRLDIVRRPQLAARMLDHVDDLVVLSDPADGETPSLALGVDQYRVYAPIGHPLLGQGPASRSVLLAEPIVCREPGSDSRAVIEQALAAHPLTADGEIDVRFEADRNEAVLQALTDGLGIAVLADRIAESALAAGAVALLVVDGFPIERRWFLQSPEGRAPTTTASLFLQFVASRLAALESEAVGSDAPAGDAAWGASAGS